MTELQHDIAKDESKYIKSALKQGSISFPPSFTSGQNNSRTASPAATSNSKAHLPARISGAYAEIDSLSNEKIALVQRIIDLLTRTRARLDSDFAKVRLLQGESPDEIRTSLVAPNFYRSSSPHTMKREGSIIGLTPVIQIGESLRNVTGSLGESVTSMALATGPSYNKSRFLSKHLIFGAISKLRSFLRHRTSFFVLYAKDGCFD